MFEIGQKVYWVVGNIISKGIVREELKNTVEVVCYEINSKPAKTRMEILKSLLICE